MVQNYAILRVYLHWHVYLNRFPVTFEHLTKLLWMVCLGFSLQIVFTTTKYSKALLRNVASSNREQNGLNKQKPVILVS